MGPHHDSHSPGAMNTPKCENPLGFAEFLPDLAYVGEIANALSSVIIGTRSNMFTKRSMLVD